MQQCHAKIVVFANESQLNVVFLQLIKPLGLSDSESDDDDDRLLPAVNVRKKSKMNGMAMLCDFRLWCLQ